MSVTTLLGRTAASLALMEPMIDKAIKTVSERREEDPENISVPIMMNLLVAAKDMIAAHRVIERVSEILTSGTMQHEGSECLQ